MKNKLKTVIIAEIEKPYCVKNVERKTYSFPPSNDEDDEKTVVVDKTLINTEYRLINIDEIENIDKLNKYFENELDKFVNENGNVYDLKEKFQIQFMLVGVRENTDLDYLIKHLKLYGTTRTEMNNSIIFLNSLILNFCNFGDDFETLEREKIQSNDERMPFLRDFVFWVNYLKQQQLN